MSGAIAYSVRHTEYFFTATVNSKLIFFIFFFFFFFFQFNQIYGAADSAYFARAERLAEIIKSLLEIDIKSYSMSVSFYHSFNQYLTLPTVSLGLDEKLIQVGMIDPVGVDFCRFLAKTADALG